MEFIVRLKVVVVFSRFAGKKKNGGVRLVSGRDVALVVVGK